MISKNKPRVIIVTGKVKITNIGLTIRLRIAKTMATINAEKYPSTATPGKNLARPTTTSADKRSFNKSLISLKV